MTATLPLSRSNNIPNPNNHKLDEFGGNASGPYDANNWGPSSVPTFNQTNVPWDEQVVPALRKKLEQESKNLSKRISRIEESDQGWAPSAIRSRESLDRRDVRGTYIRDPQEASRRQSRDLVQHGHKRESSIEQYHNRFGSVRQPRPTNNDDRTNPSLAQFDSMRARTTSTNSPLTSSPASRSSTLSSEATIRAREKARQIAARQRERVQGQAQPLGGAGIGAKDTTTIPEGLAWQMTDGSASSHRNDDENESQRQTQFPTLGDSPYGQQDTKSSFERQRLRTHSTPMRPSVDKARASTEQRQHLAEAFESMDTDLYARPHQDGQEEQLFSNHRRTPSSSRKKPAMDPKLLEEFGPLGNKSSPSSTLYKAHLEQYSPESSNTKRSRPVQPDAFRSLLPGEVSRGMRESSAPAAFGPLGGVDEFGASPGSKSTGSDWEDQIIPTVARRLQQQQLLAGDSRLSRYEGLIDTWDRNGLPLSKSDAIAAQRKAQQDNEERHQAEKARSEAEAREQEERQQRMRQQAAEEEARRQREIEEMRLQQQQQQQRNLNPNDAASVDRISQRSRQSSHRSNTSPYQTHDSQQHSQNYASQDIPMQSIASKRPSSPISQAAHSAYQPQLQPQIPPAATEYAAEPIPSAFYSQRQSQPNKQKSAKEDEGAGCCCLVM